MLSGCGLLLLLLFKLREPTTEPIGPIGGLFRRGIELMLFWLDTLGIRLELVSARVWLMSTGSDCGWPFMGVVLSSIFFRSESLRISCLLTSRLEFKILFNELIIWGDFK